MQQQDHVHEAGPKSSAKLTGYKSDKSVTRYELATALFQLANHIESSAKQPTRSARELKPGRKSALVPDPKKVRAYSDVPKDHWARASLAGLQARGFSLVPGKTFKGETVMTGDEIAVWVEALAGWTEGRAAKAARLKDLVPMGYLPQTSPLLKKAATPVTAREVSDLLTLVIARSHEKITTVSPDSERGSG